MNIFVLDVDVEKCAAYHCNKHVVKMILETAQLLCSAHWCTNGSAPYKKTHANHPCAVWCRESLDNYMWLYQLGIALCKEYTRRYEKIHKTQAIIEWLGQNHPMIPSNGMTQWPLAMPDSVKCNDVVTSYRKYYKLFKSDIAVWPKGEVPEWWDTIKL